MGQRHQVYVFVKNDKKDEELGAMSAYAYHNQWCYGTLPLRHVERIVRFQKKAQEYQNIGGSYQNDTDKIAAIMGLNMEEGVYSNYCDILEEVAEKKEAQYNTKRVDITTIDPSRGDNNDGITIIRIDAKTKEVKYCFMMLRDWDDEEEQEELGKAKKNVPLSAKEYVSLYYKEGDEKWKGLGVNKLLKALSKTELLTLNQCKQLLPKFYQKELVEA